MDGDAVTFGVAFAFITIIQMGDDGEKKISGERARGKTPASGAQLRTASTVGVVG